MNPKKSVPMFLTDQLALEVANVDAEHERLKACGVPIQQPPTDNPWGDRSCIYAILLLLLKNSKNTLSRRRGSY